MVTDCNIFNKGDRSVICSYFSQFFFSRFCASSMFVTCLIWLFTTTTFVASSELLLPDDLDGIGQMLDWIDHFPMSAIAETINVVEGKLPWMKGHHCHQWLALRRRLYYAMREREHILSRSLLVIPVPDPHAFRVLPFEISPLYPTLTFLFNSGVRNGVRFNLTIKSDRGSLRREYGISVPDRGWFGSKIEGTLLFMMHPNGIGLELFIGDQSVLMMDKPLNFRMAPTVEISGYQQRSNGSVITDMYCLTPHELCIRYPDPAFKSKWIRLQIKIVGKSLFEERGYWEQSTVKGM